MAKGSFERSLAAVLRHEGGWADHRLSRLSECAELSRIALMEQWRDIPGYPGYQASSLGRIRSLKRGTTKVLATTLDRGGYLRVIVSREGIASTPPVHQLVLLAFAGERPTPGHQGAHGNGIRTDNRADNLRWATARENLAARKRHGTHPSGERNNRAILSQQDVEYIRANYQRGTGRCNPGNVSDLARRFGVTAQTVRLAAQGKTWA